MIAFLSLVVGYLMIGAMLAGFHTGGGRKLNGDELIACIVLWPFIVAMSIGEWIRKFLRGLF